MKSKSSVVTGAPCKASAALPIKSASACAIEISKGEPFTIRATLESVDKESAPKRLLPIRAKKLQNPIDLRGYFVSFTPPLI
jgi:hypothetical protein